jgi:hypothetical protein
MRFEDPQDPEHTPAQDYYSVTASDRGESHSMFLPERDHSIDIHIGVDGEMTAKLGDFTGALPDGVFFVTD